MLPILFVSLYILFSSAVPAAAQENEAAFNAEAILPANQQTDKSYYDLKVTPGTSQMLEMRLKNTSPKKVRVQIEGNNAITNQNGALDYSQHGQKMLTNPSFESMISSPQIITLEPGEEKIAAFQLTVPEQGFDGTVLGGFYCYQVEDKQDQQTAGFSLTNRFAYTIGVQLNCSDKKIDPILELSKVTPGLDNGHLTVFATLSNLQPVLLSQLQLTAKVTKKGDKDVLHQVTKKISLAPATQFQLPVSWENEPLKPGKYELTLLLTAASGQKWTLKKEFQLTQKDKQLNQQAVELKKEPSFILYYGVIILSFIIIAGLIVYIRKLQRKQR